MKNYLALGCSYTWGQGLNEPDYIPPSWEKVEDEQHFLVEQYRYPTLVSNGLSNCKPWVRYINGGANHQNIQYLEFVLNQGFRPDYISIQFTEPCRCMNLYPWEEEKAYEIYKNDNLGFDDFLEWEKNITTITTANEFNYQFGMGLPERALDIYHQLVHIQIETLNDNLNKFRSLVPKETKWCFITWPEEMSPSYDFITPPWDNWISDSFVNVGDFNSIERLQSSDVERYRVSHKDTHPSREAHELISKSILEKFNE